MKRKTYFYMKRKTHFYMKGELVLKKRNKVTGKWSIQSRLKKDLPDILSTNVAVF